MSIQGDHTSTCLRPWKAARSTARFLDVPCPTTCRTISINFSHRCTVFPPPPHFIQHLGGLVPRLQEELKIKSRIFLTTSSTERMGFVVALAKARRPLCCCCSVSFQFFDQSCCLLILDNLEIDVSNHHLKRIQQLSRTLSFNNVQGRA